MASLTRNQERLLAENDYPSVSLTYLWPLCHSMAEEKEGLIIPFDDDDLEACIRWQAKLLVKVTSKTGFLGRKSKPGLFLEQKTPSEITYVSFQEMQPERSPSPCVLHFECDDPPELMDPTRRTHLLLAHL